MTKDKKKVEKKEVDYQTVYERQEEAWFENNCKGKPVDYWDV